MISLSPGEPSNSQPLHVRLKIELSSLLDSSQYAHGQRISSESEISSQYKVSRHVVRQALDRLVAEGRLKPRQGAGYFFNNRRVQVTLPSLTRFTELLRTADPNASVETVGRGYEEVPPWVRAELGVTGRCKILRIIRVGMIDSEPVAILEGFYASQVAKYLAKGDLSDGVYGLLSKHRILPVSSENKLKVSFVEGEKAILLNLPSGSAVLEVASTASDSEGKPIEYVRSAYRADRFVFQYSSRINGKNGKK